LKDQAGETDPSFVDKVERLYKKLAFIDHYSFLGIERRATPDDIKRAYYSAAKEFHPDRHLQSNSCALKHQLNEIFARLTEVYRILCDRKLRMEYDLSVSKTDSRHQTGKFDLAKIRFREGEEAFRRGSYPEAVELFGQAVYLDGTVATYYYHLGLALEKQKRINDAAKMLNQALKLDPYNADYVAEFGHICLHLGFHLRARSSFEKALKFDPLNKRAAAGLQIIRNRG
jgi:curved DNA-binding protein CbpA